MSPLQPPTWAFDTLDRDTVMTFHDGSMRTNVFNLASNIVGYTDENGSVFANTFDVLGRKTDVGITLAAGVVGTTAQSYQFDGLSGMSFSRDSVGSTNADAAFVLDSLRRVVEEPQTYAGDSRYVTQNALMSYTPTGFTFPNGRQITTAFDALYRKNGVSEGGSSIAAWQFFGGRIATVTLGNGIVTSFMNDTQTRSAIQFGRTTPGWGDIATDHLGYDGAGRLIGKRHFNGSAVLVGSTAAYDKSANKLFERALHAESRSNLYANDSMNRLVNYRRGVLTSGGGSITAPISLPDTNQEQAYNLDGLGNWSTTVITPGGGVPATQTRTHNRLNEVTAFGVLPASTPVHYDQGNNSGTPPQKGNGNIIDDGVRLNAFDALNRLVTVARKSDGLQIGAYVYDAIGRRIVHAVSSGGLSGAIPSGTSRYLLNGQQIVEELSGSTGPATVQYVWGQYIDELIQLNALTTVGPQPLAADTYYLLSDLLYRSAALTRTAGGAAVVEAFDTDAYGNTLLFSGPGADGLWFTDDDSQGAYSACRYVFTGREYDAETQLYFYRARHYQPTLARFIGKDPGGYIGGLSLYQYLSSRPVRGTDPSGLYERDFHYDVILLLLRMKCWDEGDAEVVARASQNVDEDPRTEPMGLGWAVAMSGARGGPAADRLRDFHFPGSSPTAATVPDDPIARANVVQGFASGNLELAGTLLHPYADSWSHAGFSAYRSPAINARPGGVGPPVGHAQAGHAPDLPYTNPEAALDAAMHIYALIPNRCRCSDGVPWDDIAARLAIAFGLHDDVGERANNIEMMRAQLESDHADLLGGGA